MRTLIKELEAHKYPFTYTPNNNANDISHFLENNIKSKQTDMHNRVSTWYKQILQSSPQTICHTLVRIHQTYKCS